MDISTMAQTIGPLARNRQVIGIDLEGHGRTALRDTPLSHERNGGGDAAIRMAIQHPDMVRPLIVISTAAERDGWFPEGLAGMEAVSSAQADHMKQTPIYSRYAKAAPHPEQFPLLLCTPRRPHGLSIGEVSGRY
jgi:hypothetical protein